MRNGCACPGCTGGEVCPGDKVGYLCPGCVSGEHGRDRRHEQLRKRRDARATSQETTDSGAANA